MNRRIEPPIYEIFIKNASKSDIKSINTMETWNFGTWNPGTLELWNFGTSYRPSHSPSLSTAVTTFGQ